MPADPPAVKIMPAKRSIRERMSVVWIIPLIALVIVLGVAWQSFNDRGPVIRILFDNAAGVKAGATELRFRDVVVGSVEKVGFVDELRQVFVDVRVDKEVAPYIDSTATFWVVSPQVTARGITGLGTVLSGVFIEGSWDGVADGTEYEFTGLDSAPLIRSGERGLQIALRSKGNTNLSENTPILYRGVEVGRMGQAVISRNGEFTIAEAIIYEPHDRLISRTTRFWDTSGFSFSIGAGGAELDFSSIATLIGGGITFETLVSGDEPISDGTVFEVYDSESEAKASVYNASDVEPLEISAIFLDNIAGLSVGAPVELSGLEIGEITSLNGLVDRERFGDARVRLKATMAIQPARLGLPGTATPEAALEFLNERVTNAGLRARLASASILTGGLKVELVGTDTMDQASMRMEGDPFPIIPVTRSVITDVSATAEGVFSRINSLPVEDLMQGAIDFLNSATALVSDEKLRETPAEVLALLGDMRGLVGSDAAQEVPALLNAAIGRVEMLLVRLDEEQAIARLVTSLEAVSKAATQVGDASTSVPSLLQDIERLAEKAVDLPLEQLLIEARGLVVSGRTLLSSDDAKALPASLNAALAQVDGLLGELRAEQGITRLLAAVDRVSAAASSADAAVAGVPELVSSLDVLAKKAADLPLEQLLLETRGMVASGRTLLGSEAAQALPASLNAALTRVDGLIAELRAEQGVQRLLAAVDGVTKAAVSADVSIAGVPDLIKSLDDLVAKANGLPLETIAQRLSEVLTSTNALIDSPDARELPANLSDALGELQATLSDLRKGGVVENVNKTLLSARIAADSIAASVEDLPVLVDRMVSLLNQANATLKSYDGTSDLNRGARSALRDIAEAAEAVSSLARTLERNPNSLLLGR